QKGSDTDQGRIHIKYGLPTDIERSPFSATGKAFEIWTYEHLNYYEFVFLDRLGDGVYEMIHATMPGERYNPNWRDEQAIGDQTDPTSLPSEAFSPP
ncbi:MAG: GWxTD domain-containing protein, partial [Candidatus Latescibacteria bacterium]|nr:GWxTD domain-containing protein [Candidatus Latescibacterota bacterium]